MADMDLGLSTDPNTPILEVEDLNISFYTRKGEIPAVMDFSMTVMSGETMGLVGESGCGKSTVSLGIMQYLGHNGRIKSGTIKFMGRDMATFSREELRNLRGSRLAPDVYDSRRAMLNPTHSLAMMMHSTKGAFAMLLGSGISVQAGVPSGWQVVEDLVRKIALLEGERIEGEPAAWFRARSRRRSR